MTQQPITSLSIVIPVGAGDASLSVLLQDLVAIPHTWEIVIVAVNGRAGSEPAYPSPRTRLTTCAATQRAAQLNHGARLAVGRYVWFLHADSRVSGPLLVEIKKRLVRAPCEGRLLYFDLAFHDSKHMIQRLNAFGANLRSRILGMPFGDQGLLIAKKDYERVRGFSETAAYGEDHLFVWHCRQTGIKLERVPQTLETSARKYNQGGWFKVTYRHFVLTWKQALPECYKLMVRRSSREHK